MNQTLELNKIYQMDCMKGMELISDQSIDLVLTDIPYGNVTKNGEDRARYTGQMRNMNKADADTETFDLIPFLEHCYRMSKGSIYIFCGIEQMSKIFNFFDEKKDVTTRQCIWHKTNPSPVNGQHYWIHAIENCVFVKRRKTTFRQHCKHNVWDHPAGRSKLHPTQKPIGLFKHLVESSTNEGDIVFDPCIGSGTSAVAAKELGRQYLGFDISAEYVEIANSRLSGLV